MNAYTSVSALAVDWEQLALAAGLTITITTVVAYSIHGPLFDVLRMVCGSDVGARFWTTFASVLLVMGPLFLVFTAANGAYSVADFVRRSVYLVSLGIIASFLVMGVAVLYSARLRGSEQWNRTVTSDDAATSGAE